MYRISDGQTDGIDIDNVYYDSDYQVVDGATEDDPKGAEYGDYEMRRRPGVSGSGVIIPEMEDSGLPEYIVNPDGSKTRTGMEDVSYLKNFLSGDSESLDSMLEPVNNGRMSDINDVRDTVLKENSDIVIKKDNQESSIKGLLEQNSINDIFFSEMNVKGIQDSIRYGVYQETKQVISPQSPNELYIIMRSIMLQYANFRVGIDKIADEIKRLNNKVLIYCIQNVSSNVRQHMGYIEELEKLPQPMDRPAYGERNNYTYDISNLL
tara:strand:- start:380 stop:1174 length:795 start_codon:yes stop_codon:yes gene_type:complete